MTRRARKRLLLVLVAGAATITFAVGAYTLRQAQKQRMLAEKLEEGMAAYEARDYATAINALSYYVRRRGDNAEATLALADSWRRVPAENDGHIMSAIVAARQAADLAEDKVPALEMLLELYGQARYMSERLQTAERLLAIKPAHAEAMLARTGSLMVLGRLPQAMESARAMTQALPDNIDGHWTVVGLMEMMTQPRPEIVAYAAEVAASHPTLLRAQAMHIHVMLRSGETLGAAEAARGVLSLPAESIEAVSEYLRVLDSLVMGDEANEFLAKEIAAARFGPKVAVLAAERAWKSGRPSDARQHIASAAAAGDDEAMGWAAFLEAESPGATGASLEAIKNRSTPAAVFWVAMVESQRELAAGRVAEAREHLRSALAARPESTLAEYLLGRVHESVGDWISAVAMWESVVLRDPGYRVARLALVSTLLRQGRIDEARDQARRALTARSGLVEVFSVSRAFIAGIEAGSAPSDEVERVIGVLENLRGRPASDPIVLPLLARAYLGVGRTAQAQEIVRTIIEEGPLPSTEDTVGLAAALRPRFPELAGTLLDAASTAAPGDTDLVFVTAMAAARAGRTDEARRQMEAAAAAAEGPARAGAQLQLAVFLYRTDSPDAREHFAKLAAELATNARVQIALLESQSAWNDESTVAAAIGRLRAVAGDSSPVWKLHEARRVLQFDRSSEQAARVVQLLADLLRTDPDNAAGMTLMADAMLLLEDRTKAIDFLSRVVDANSTPALYPVLVSLLRDSGRTDDVQRRMREFLRLNPVPLELRRTRAQLLASHGMLGDAMREFEALAAGGTPIDQLNLARLCVRRGEIARAAGIVDALLAVPDPGAPVVLAAAEIAAIQGDIDGGLAMLDRLPATIPVHEAAMHRGAYLDRHGRSEQAEQAYQRAAAGGSVEAAAAMISFYITRGRHDEAEAALARGTAAHPDHPDLKRLRSLARVARGGEMPGGMMADVAAMVVSEGDERTRQQFLDAMRTAEANPADRAGLISRLRRITEASPTFYPAWYFLVSTLIETGDLVEAAQRASFAAQVMPTDPRAARLAVSAFASAGRAPEALDMARQWRDRIVGGSLDADAVIATLCLQLNRDQEGLAALEPWKSRLVADSAANPERTELYASLLARAGRHEDAHALLWPLVQRDAGLAGMYLRVASQLSGAAAANRTEWITRVEPVVAPRVAVDPRARFDLAQAWYIVASEDGQTARFGRVIEVLGDDPSELPDPARAALLLAASHEATGNADAAMRFYRLAIEREPNNAAARNNLAYLLVSTGGSPDEALPHARRAVELANAGGFPPPFRASFLDTLGVVLLRLQEYEAAARAFSDALAISPRDIRLLIGAAEAQVRGGDAAAATATVRSIDSMIGAGTTMPPPLESRLQVVRGLLSDTGASPN